MKLQHHHHHHHLSLTDVAYASSANVKQRKKKLGPKYIRELEGVLYRFRTTTTTSSSPEFDTFQHPMVAVLMSESEFTKSAILRANSSPIPFFLLHLPAVDNSNDTTTEDDGLGDLGMALCNPALCGRDGLLRGNMELRWERRGLGGDGRGRPAVWWGNQKLHSWTPELNVTS